MDFITNVTLSPYRICSTGQSTTVFFSSCSSQACHNWNISHRTLIVTVRDQTLRPIDRKVTKILLAFLEVLRIVLTVAIAICMVTRYSFATRNKNSSQRPHQNNINAYVTSCRPINTLSAQFIGKPEQIPLVEIK